MTKIKFCGLRQPAEIEAVNRLRPEYIGFVFASKSKRCIDIETAGYLKGLLHPGIQAVGVFVNAQIQTIAELLEQNVIDLAQLHGDEDNTYIQQIRRMTGRPVIRAFRIRTQEDAAEAARCLADYILLDSGAGTGETFDWNMIADIKRPYFLAGGLNPDNVGEAITRLHPYAVDVSSGIETGGYKDIRKMEAFVAACQSHIRTDFEQQQLL